MIEVRLEPRNKSVHEVQSEHVSGLMQLPKGNLSGFFALFQLVCRTWGHAHAAGKVRVAQPSSVSGMKNPAPPRVAWRFAKLRGQFVNKLYSSVLKSSLHDEKSKSGKIRMIKVQN